MAIRFRGSLEKLRSWAHEEFDCKTSPLIGLGPNDVLAWTYLKKPFWVKEEG